MTSSPFVPFVDGLWIAHDSELSMLGLRLGSRMTVIRLAGGGLLVHSPLAITAELARAVEALGEVTHIVAPNVYHHLFAGEAKARWPKALLHAPGALRRKRKDLAIDLDLGARPHPDWDGVLEPLVIEGSALKETAFFHPATRTLVSSDLTENFLSMPHLPTRLYLQANGTWQRPGWPLVLRVVYQDRKAARRSIDAVLERDFDRVILAHGEPIERGGKDAIRATFEFLR